jgi:hypothetical protein
MQCGNQVDEERIWKKKPGLDAKLGAERTKILEVLMKIQAVTSSEEGTEETWRRHEGRWSPDRHDDGDTLLMSS